ncbi:MAG: type 4a pilus biogenesis protein PilO [Myxococcota bacterium]|nr:type 4a pilus biogenesis protein PilO [Myxococcota bacterium]
MEGLLKQYGALPQTQRIGMLFLPIICIVGLYYTMWYQDQHARIAQKKVQLKQTSQEIANKRAYARNLTKYEARIEKQKQRLEHARSLLPDNTNVAELLAQFGAKAEQTGLEIKSFKPGGVTKRKLFSEIQFEVQVVGSFHEIATFIESLSQIDQITTVGAFSMQPKSSNTEEHLNLNAQLQVTTFRFNRAG